MLPFFICPSAGCNCCHPRVVPFFASFALNQSFSNLSKTITVKKVMYLFAVVLLAGLTACGGAENEAAAEAEAQEAIDNMTDMLEEAVEEAADEAAAEGELAEHVCNDDCTEEGCSFKHGEMGHECTDACTADMGGEEGADGGEEMSTEG